MKNRNQSRVTRRQKLELLVDTILIHMQRRGRITLSEFDWEQHNKYE